jgi:soluble lytic murein transglycosylase-like protein
MEPRLILKARKADRSALAATGCLLALAFALPASAAEIAHLRNGFTIRHEHRKLVGSNTRLFMSADDSSFVDVATADIEAIEPDTTPPPAPVAATAPAATTVAMPSISASPKAPVTPAPTGDLNQVVNSASATYHLDPDLVNSVIHAESSFRPQAISPKGAQGLMQLMPQTANELGVKNPLDPKSNVGGGTLYLRQLLEKYNFDLVKALAAYNAGPKRVQQYGGVPPYRETRAYVARIVRDYNRKKVAQEKLAAAAQKNAAPKPNAAQPATQAQSAAGRPVSKRPSTRATTPSSSASAR